MLDKSVIAQGLEPMAANDARGEYMGRSFGEEVTIGGKVYYDGNYYILRQR